MNADGLYGLMQRNGLQWGRYLERQGEWADFVQGYPCKAFDLNGRLNTASGILNHGTIRIGIVAMNTSWASHTEKEDGQLWLGQYQLQTATASLRDFDFKILATHHPVAWLNTAERSEAEAKVQSSSHLHLHGHVHYQWFVPADGHLRVQAGACYAGSAKQNGYSWIEIDFIARKAQLHLRTYTDDGKGGWIPRYIPDKTNEQGRATIESLFSGPGSKIPMTTSPPLNPRKNDELTQDNSPQSNASSDISAPKSIPSYINALENAFSFRWEPGDFDIAKAEATTVYWPVRLRKPTVIHAVQAYAAAGLQRVGAKVILCLDDLGNIQGNVQAFSQRVNRWFLNMAGTSPTFEVRTFKEVVTSERYHAAWELLQSWLSDARYELKDILAISKMWPRDSDPSTFALLLSRKPRRLLTPALVWTCLVHLIEEAPERQLITLSGYDERPLWDAWRDCIKQPLPVGHLYIPELTQPDTINSQQAVHMARPDSNLSWESREDIRLSLKEALLNEDWPSSGRLVPWVLAGGVQLPRYLNHLPLDVVVKGIAIRNISDLHNIDKGALVSSIESEVSRYIF